MAKLKKINKLNKTVSAQLAPFGISQAICGNEYAYYFDDEKITFALTVGMSDKWFDEFIKVRFNYEVKFPFVITLLHEVGHHKANDNICDDIDEFCMTEKERIETRMGEDDITVEEQKQLTWQYFNLPDEIMATQWAVNYAKKHPRKVKKMWNEIAPVLMEFYQANLDPKVWAE